MYWNLSDKDRLIKALELAQESNSTQKFLSDILTPKELKSCMIRLKAVCMINDVVPYTQIQKQTGLSSRTIARLAKLYNEQDSGFQKVLRKFKRLGKAYFD